MPLLIPVLILHLLLGGSTTPPITEGEAILDQLRQDRNLETAREAMHARFDEAIADVQRPGRVSRRAMEPFIDAAGNWQAIRLLEEIDEERRNAFLDLRVTAPSFTRTLLFLLDLEHDDLEQALVLAHRLHEQRSESLETYADLAAAICVVHDGTLHQRVNENRAIATDPLSLYDYFRDHESMTAFGIRNVSAELLIYVVDVTCNIDEMMWAMQSFGRQSNLEDVYHQVVYDRDHLLLGTPKRVTREGWSLANILRYGGVCADRAYFASTIGKVAGIPAVYIWAKNGTVGHAWIGFVRPSGAWHGTAGRGPSYAGVQAVIRNPQTRGTVSDCYLPLLVNHARSTRSGRETQDQLRRHFSVACRIAADRIDQRSMTGPEQETRVEMMLDLLHTGLAACPTDARSWLRVRDIAIARGMTLPQKREWAVRLDTYCSTDYPDFTYEVLSPMIKTVDSTRDQERLWNNALKVFHTRPDLAGRVLTEMADMWIAVGETRKAGMCHEQIVRNYPNEGPFVIPAIRHTAALLQELEGTGARLRFLEQAWISMRQPEDIAMIWGRQSNWYRAGMLFVEALQEEGMEKESRTIRFRIQQALGN